MKTDDDFSFYDLFVPLTVKKAIYLIVILGFIVFSNMLFNKFVWDDRTFIQFNPEIQNLNLGFLLGPNMFNNINAGQYRFFVALYFTFLHTFFSDTAFFYHFIQLVIHILNSILVFLLLKRFFKIVISFFLALVFLVHPIQVESVSFIASSGNTLFTFFGLLALLISFGKNTWKKITLVFALLLLSLLSKETGIVFVFLAVFSKVLFNKKNSIVYFLSATGIVLFYFYLRFIVGKVFFSKIHLVPISHLSFSERLLTVPSVFFYYIKTFLLPVNLAIEQLWVVTRLDLFHFYMPLLIDCIFLSFLAFLASYIFKKDKKIFLQFIFFTIWFFAGIFPYLQLMPLDMTVADRWFYLPIIGFLGIIGCIFQLFLPLIIRKRKVLIVVAVVVICILSIRTIVRNSNWIDPITLYTHDSKIANNYDIENSLAGELGFVGREQEAFSHYQKSVAMFPHETNLFNLGLSYEKNKDYKSAQKYYLRAYDSPNLGQVPFPHTHHEVTYERLTVSYLREKSPKALQVIAKGLDDYSTDPQLWYLKAIYLFTVNNRTEAIIAAKKAYTLFPQNPSIKNLYERLVNNLPINITME
jgi:tetratricopeptide (TPR) repeat protein